MKKFEKIKQLFREHGISSISRRYFISNGFDGALTGIGIVVGSFLSGIPSGVTIIKISLGAAVGLGTSGVWSVWEIERAEKKAEILKIEKAMLTDLDDTNIQKNKTGARKINAIMSGIGPLIGVLIPIIPFFLVDPSYITPQTATIASIGIAITILFIFGAYMGKISKQKWYISGIRMGLAGLIVAFINIFLPG